VTLVAFGSASPELFLNSVSAFTGTSDLSLSAILGSGMIAFGFIPPLCLLFSNKATMQIRIQLVIREVRNILFIYFSFIIMLIKCEIVRILSDWFSNVPLFVK
jgi:Ca2+/Na+ antiporter